MGYRGENGPATAEYIFKPSSASNMQVSGTSSSFAISPSNIIDIIDQSMFIEILSSWFGSGSVALTDSSCTSVTTISASRLVLFYPM